MCAQVIKLRLTTLYHAIKITTRHNLKLISFKSFKYKLILKKSANTYPFSPAHIFFYKNLRYLFALIFVKLKTKLLKKEA